MKKILFIFLILVNSANAAYFANGENFVVGTVEMGKASGLLNLFAEIHPPGSDENTKISTLRLFSASSGYKATGGGIRLLSMTCWCAAASKLAVGYGTNDVGWSGANPSGAHWGGGVANGDLAMMFYLPANTQSNFSIGMLVPVDNYPAIYTFTDAQPVFCTMWAKQE